MLTPDLAASDLDEIHIAAARMRLARDDRDHAIRAAYADGVPVSQIAEQAEVSRQRIHQILAAG